MMEDGSSSSKEKTRMTRTAIKENSKKNQKMEKKSESQTTSTPQRNKRKITGESTPPASTKRVKRDSSPDTPSELFTESPQIEVDYVEDPLSDGLNDLPTSNFAALKEMIELMEEDKQVEAPEQIASASTSQHIGSQTVVFEETSKTHYFTILNFLLGYGTVKYAYWGLDGPHGGRYKRSLIFTVKRLVKVYSCVNLTCCNSMNG